MTTTTLTRDSYGALYAAPITTATDRAMLDAAYRLIALAATAGKLPAAYDDMEWGRSGRERGHRIGTALHHEIYDLAANGATVLVCARSVEGTRYGVKTAGKSYYLVRRHGRGTQVSEASKAVAAKAAKAAGAEIGLDIAVVQGKRPAPAPKCLAPRTGYKIVRRDGDSYVSVWDGSSWAIGRCRTEAATPTHNGGFYYYASLDEALAEAGARQTFGADGDYHDLAILEVVVSGRQFEHASQHGTKLCATHLKPLREVCAVLA